MLHKVITKYLKFLMAATIFTYGFTCIITQILFLREFLNFFNANELILGIFFSLWMLFVAAGAWFAKFYKNKFKNIKLFLFIQFLSGILPLLSILLLRYIRNEFILPGQAVSINHVVFASSATMLIFCFLSGFFFTLLCAFRAQYHKDFNINTVYITETLGSVAGGLLFSFILVYFFTSMEILRFIFIINAICFILWNIQMRKFAITAIAILCIVIISFSYNFNLDVFSKEKFFTNQEIVKDIETPYGNITLTTYFEQFNLYQNGYLMYAAGDNVAAEEKVHHALMRHPNPKHVLLISGGISGTLYELLKYKNITIDYVDNNPFIIAIGKEFNLIPPDSINIHIKDPVIFLKRNIKKYDVIIVDMPEPATANLNRFFTVEFFSLLNANLNAGGIISTGLNSTAQYMNKQSKDLNSVVFKAISETFSSILAIQGSRNFYIASQSDISYAFNDNIYSSKIETYYVPYYFDENDLQWKRNKFIEELDTLKTPLNTNFNPVAYLMQNKIWLSLSNHNIYIILILVLVLIVLMFLRFNAVAFCLFSGGYAGMSFELIILFTFQIIFGYLYTHIGFIIALFMGGLAMGAIGVQHMKIKATVMNLVKIQLFIAVGAVLFTFFILALRYNFCTTLLYVTMYLFTFVFAICAGVEFSLSALLLKKNETLVASEVYSADMLGAALGAILPSVIIIPLFGIIEACYIIVVLNVISGLYLFAKRKKYQQ